MDDLELGRDGTLRTLGTDDPDDTSTDSDSGDEKGGGKSKGTSKATPWVPEGKVSDAWVKKAFLHALLKGARERENGPRKMQRLFFLSLLGAVAGLALIGWLVVTAKLGGTLGFVYLVIVGIVGLVLLAKWLEVHARTHVELPRVSAVTAFLSPGGAMLSAALRYLERAHERGEPWAENWYDQFRSTWGRNLDPLVELPGVFVQELMDLDRMKAEAAAAAAAAKAAPEEAPKSSSLKIPSVFGFIKVLFALASWIIAFGIIVYLWGVFAGWWTYQDTLGKHISPYVPAVQQAWADKDRTDPNNKGMYPGSPQGATGPSDKLHERAIFSGAVPYVEKPDGH